jgi:hypothetical protein
MTLSSKTIHMDIDDLKDAYKSIKSKIKIQEGPGNLSELVTSF